MASSPLDETQFESPRDSLAVDWIEPELSSRFGTVGALVPNRYESFIRVFHPATTSDGNLATWSQVAQKLGRRMHPSVQWHALVGSSDPEGLSGSEWAGGAPERGDMPAQLLKALGVALGSDAEPCCFGLWIGWTSVSVRVSWERHKSPKVITGERRGSDIPGARFELPRGSGRDFLLVRGPLIAASEIAEAIDPDGAGGSLIHLVWPLDRTWYLATDIDFDSTILAGSLCLTDHVAASSGIEALRVEPTDSLTANADQVNSSRGSA